MLIRFLFVLALLMPGLSFAGPKKNELPERTGPRSLGDDPVEDFDLLDLDGDDDPLFHAKSLESKNEIAIPSIIAKVPLQDNYEPVVSKLAHDALIVDVPVLLSKSKLTASFDNEFQLIGQIVCNGKILSKSVVFVEKEMLAEFGPTFAFMRFMFSVDKESGTFSIEMFKKSDEMIDNLWVRKIQY